MKVIDLLVKLANNQDLPKKVLILDKVYYLMKRNNKYFYSRNSHDFRDWERDLDHSINVCCYLNEEVTILDKNDNEVKIVEEKPKKIEKLEKRCEYVRNGLFPTGFGKEYYDKEDIIAKIEELRNAVNYLLEKSDSE